MMKCKHYKGEGYTYTLKDNEELFLCDQCNLNLCIGVQKQIAIEIFTNSMMLRQLETIKERKVKKI